MVLPFFKIAYRCYLLYHLSKRSFKDMKISIITTTYNSLLTIGDTLDSILNQSYGDFESIIIDGISTDGTLDVIKEYQLKFNGKLRCLSEPDCGIYDAMNKGIKMATGDIIGVLNSDDFSLIVMS